MTKIFSLKLTRFLAWIQALTVENCTLEIITFSPLLFEALECRMEKLVAMSILSQILKTAVFTLSFLDVP